MEDNESISLWCDTLCVELIFIHAGHAALVSYSLAKVVNPDNSGKFAANLEVLWILIGFSILNSNLMVLFIGLVHMSSPMVFRKLMHRY